MDKKNIDEIVAKVIGAMGGAKPAEQKMTLSLAKALNEKVREKAKSMNMRVVTAVVDAGGNPVAVECMDDAFLASYEIALNKAFTSVALKMSTKVLAPLAAPSGSLYGIQFTNQGRIVIFGGGVPLRAGETIIGGFGVSGGTAAEDTLLGDYAAEVFETLV